MFTTLSLFLLALLGTAAQGQPGRPDGPPVEVFDIEVVVHVVRPSPLTGARDSARPPEPIVGRENIPGSASSRQRDKPTVASRSAELSRVAGRGPSHPPAGGSSPLYRYDYRLKVRNTGAKKVKSILWEYQVLAPAGAPDPARRLFLCAAGIKPGADKRLSVQTPLAPFNVVSADGPGDQPPLAKAVVNRVEYADGSTWRRGDWEQSDSEVARAVDAGRRLRGGECVVW